MVYNSRGHTTKLETIGKRVARLRVDHGWTQQYLATRLAISRVAVSHIEMDLTVPSERTLILLAGLFKNSPHELADGTTYPDAKAEKLPFVVCTYTPLEVDLELLENDLKWLDRLSPSVAKERFSEEIYQHWSGRLAIISEQCQDERERQLLTAALNNLRSLQTVSVIQT